MRRKIIMQGTERNRTYTLTLPSEWVKAHGLNKGDELEINTIGHTLIISTNNGPFVNKEVTIDGTKLDITLLRRKLTVAYCTGAIQITVKHAGKEFIDSRTKKPRTIEEDVRFQISHDMIGMEYEESNGTMVIKEFGQTNEAEFNTSIRRIFIQLKRMTHLLPELQASSEGHYRLWLEDRVVNKYVNFGMRIIHTKNYIHPAHSLHMYSLLTQFELLGDAIVKIADTKQDEKELSKMSRLLENAIEFIEKYYYTGLDENVTELLNIRNEIKVFKGNKELIALVRACYAVLSNMVDTIAALTTKID